MTHKILKPMKPVSDKHIRLEYSEREGFLHFASVTEARAVKYPALVNRIPESIAWDFSPYAYRMIEKHKKRLTFAKMKELYLGWLAKYMAKKKKRPAISEYYQLCYSESGRDFHMVATQEDMRSYSNWSVIAHRVHIDTVIDFTENARRVFAEHADYYPDRQAVRYALQMWIAYHAESNTAL